MRSKRLVLQNVGRVEYLDWEFKPGVIGILGPNGSGKSTAVNAMYAALTNDYSRFEGGKKGCIRQQAGEKDPSYIQVVLEHGGHIYTIRRGLRPDNHLFHRKGSSKDEDLTKATDIASHIEDELGITRSLLDNYAFVSQWDMFAFLSLTDGERAKHFAKLCGTTHAEVCWTELGRQIELDRLLSMQIADDTDEIKKELRDTRSRRKKLDRDLTMALRGKCDEEHLERARSTIRNRSLYVQARKSWTQVSQKTAELLRDVEDVTREVAEAENLLCEIQVQLGRWQDDVEALADEKSRLDQQLDLQAKRRRLLRELSSLKKEKKAKPVKPAEIKPFDISDLEEASREAYKKFDKANVLATDCDGVSECPTCSTPTDTPELRKKIAKAKEDLDGLRKEKDEAVRLVELHREYTAQLQQYEVWKAAYSAKVERYKQQIREIPLVEEDVTCARLKEIARVTLRRDKYRKKEKRLQVELRELRDAKAWAVDLYTGAKHKRERVAEVLKNKVTADEEKQAASMLKDHEATVEKIANLRAQIRMIDEKKDELKGRLTRISRAIERNERGRKWLALMNGARGVLHRDSLPAEVHKSLLLDMEDDINADLLGARAPFYVRATDNLSFTGFFQDGTIMPAGGLSGGEKVLLALPFRLQVYSLFAPQVGMLVLDEPTAGLDEGRVQAVIDILDQLRGTAKSEGFQIIVITHETALERAFDQVFRCDL